MSSMAKGRNTELLQSKHAPQNPKQDVMFTVEHNVEKKIRWETSKWLRACCGALGL